MLFWIYWLIAVAVLLLTTRDLLRADDLRKQLAASVVLVPIILRVFLLK